MSCGTPNRQRLVPIHQHKGTFNVHHSEDVLLSTLMKKVIAVLYRYTTIRRSRLRLYLDERLLRKLLAEAVTDSMKNAERPIRARRQHTERRGI